MSVYDDFAADYHWLFDSLDHKLGTRTPGVRAALAGLAPRASILDAACGIGLDALSLAKRGFQVMASDESPEMVAATQTRCSDQPNPPRVVQSRWNDLPAHFGSEAFDAVLCTGNSIAGLPDQAETLDALWAFRTILKPHGMLIVDTHDWPQIYQAGETLEVESVTSASPECSIRRSYSWRFPEGSTGPYRLRFGFEVTSGVVTVVRSYDATSYPFSAAELRSRLNSAGFTRCFTDNRLGQDRYTAIAYP